MPTFSFSVSIGADQTNGSTEVVLPDQLRNRRLMMESVQYVLTNVSAPVTRTFTTARLRMEGITNQHHTYVNAYGGGLDLLLDSSLEYDRWEARQDIVNNVDLHGITTCDVTIDVPVATAPDTDVAVFTFVFSYE